MKQNKIIIKSLRIPSDLVMSADGWVMDYNDKKDPNDCAITFSDLVRIAIVKFIETNETEKSLRQYF